MHACMLDIHTRTPALAADLGGWRLGGASSLVCMRMQQGQQGQVMMGLWRQVRVMHSITDDLSVSATPPPPSPPPAAPLPGACLATARFLVGWVPC